MKFIPIKFSNAYIIELETYQDKRGWFSRVFCMNEFKCINHSKPFVQINHSYNKHKGTLRGMHYQNPPYAEIKLIRCIRGRVFDVIIDIRKNSSTFLQWFGIELSEENKKMIYLSDGFAHGFQTLTDNCELLYHHTSLYKSEAESSIRYNDPLIGINWHLTVTTISDKDKNYPLLDDNFKGIQI